MTIDFFEIIVYNTFSFTLNGRPPTATQLLAGGKSEHHPPYGEIETVANGHALGKKFPRDRQRNRKYTAPSLSRGKGEIVH